jgi:hypothetical protein
MYVFKRSGKRESVHFDKITSRISKLCYGLDAQVSERLAVCAWVVLLLLSASMLPSSCCGFRASVDFAVFGSASHHIACFVLLDALLVQHVDPVIISQKVIQGVYPGVTTSELDE